ncbi:hypothetical protein KP509_20G039100 [Ceratopteris richardii]|nr:hypothetical protein KP509_20G039100 [Ceratopteris richardii]
MVSMDHGSLQAENSVFSTDCADPSEASDAMAEVTPISSVLPGRSRSMDSVSNHSKRESGDDDDGSVATKLLASISKSISSPSLLSVCKEPVRETPYQKTLRLKTMKLHHCAEELGSESCEDFSAYRYDGYWGSFDSLTKVNFSEASIALPALPTDVCQESQLCESDGCSTMISVKSVPNLTRCSTFPARQSSRARERSFPPPLSHTLPRSASSDSFALSLRAYREEGRFTLREVKVPCQKYFQANRKDGRLTLKLFVSDDALEQGDSVQQVPIGTSVPRDDLDTTRKQANVMDALEKDGGTCEVSGDQLEVRLDKREKEVDQIVLSEQRKIGFVRIDDNEMKVTEVSIPSEVSPGKKVILSNHVDCPELLHTAIAGLSSGKAGGGVDGINELKPWQSSFQILKTLASPGKAGHTSRFYYLNQETSDVGSLWNWNGFKVEKDPIFSATMVVLKDVSSKRLMENVTALMSSPYALKAGKICSSQIIKPLGGQGQIASKKKKKKDTGISAQGKSMTSISDDSQLVTIRVRKLCKDWASVMKKACDGDPEGWYKLSRTDLYLKSLDVRAQPIKHHSDVQSSPHYGGQQAFYCKVFDRNQFSIKTSNYVAIRT